MFAYKLMNSFRNINDSAISEILHQAYMDQFTLDQPTKDQPYPTNPNVFMINGLSPPELCIQSKILPVGKLEVLRL